MFTELIFQISSTFKSLNFLTIGKNEWRKTARFVLQMKHTLKVTTILIAMFVIAQLIGLYAVNFYLNADYQIPYGFNEQKTIEKTPGFYTQFLVSLIFSFIVAVLIVFFLMRVQSLWLIRTWFFIVIAIALGITLNILIAKMNLQYSSIIALALGILLAYFKVFRKNVIIHNLTEVMIYPGIAVIFVSMLNIWTAILLLVLISIYDMWAVWCSGIMMKMAKYQINNVGFLGGFMLPYASKKIKEKILLLKNKYKNKKIPEKEIKKNKIKIGLAILGGGDIVFPIIATGVFFKTFNSLPGALMITLFSTLALIALFIFGDKKKAYPAMPYLTMGILLGMLVAVFLGL